MATSIGLKAFQRRIRVLSKITLGNVEKRVRKAALAADQVAVLATPVDTGRARANWRVGIGTNPAGYDDEATDKSGSSTIAEGQGVIERWKSGQGSIFISNNVPYIIPLDEGSSAQAPSGMSAAAVQAARKFLVNGPSLFKV